MKKKCQFTLIDRADGWARWRCTACKYETVPIPDKGQRIDKDCDRQGGLGDFVGRLLSLVGITQARMAIVGWTCGNGCEERKAILNQVGWRLSDRLNTWLGH